VSGCASLDERLISNDAPTRLRAVQKFRSLPVSKRNKHLETLMTRVGAGGTSSEEDSICSTFYCKSDVSKANALSTIKALGPLATYIALPLVRVYTCCPKSEMSEQIKDVLPSVVGTNADSLISKYADDMGRRRSVQAKEKVLALINRIKGLADSTRPAFIYSDDDKLFHRLARLYNEISVALDPVSAKDRASVPLGPIIYPMLYNGSPNIFIVNIEKEVYKNTEAAHPDEIFVNAFIELLAKLGPTSIPILQQLLANSLVNYDPAVTSCDYFDGAYSCQPAKTNKVVEGAFPKNS